MWRTTWRLWHSLCLRLRYYEWDKRHGYFWSTVTIIFTGLIWGDTWAALDSVKLQCIVGSCDQWEFLLFPSPLHSPNGRPLGLCKETVKQSIPMGSPPYWLAWYMVVNYTCINVKWFTTICTVSSYYNIIKSVPEYPQWTQHSFHFPHPWLWTRHGMSIVSWKLDQSLTFVSAGQ